MKQFIHTVSTGFCKFINLDKMDLIGKELSYIIPEGYKEVHDIRLSYLLDFENDHSTEVIPSKVFHNELLLPIKGKNQEMFTGFVCIRSHIDIEEGIGFVSIIKNVALKSLGALIDFEGNIT